MHTTSFRLRPIDPATADTLRARGGPLTVVDHHPGYPCRQCLLDADVGDELILVSHDPFTADSPYRSATPIFLHVRPCEPALTTGPLPTQLTSRLLSVRSFDDNAMMIDAAVIEGMDLERTIVASFDEPATHEIHVHNATRGCWAVTVERALPANS